MTSVHIISYHPIASRKQFLSNIRLLWCSITNLPNRNKQKKQPQAQVSWKPLQLAPAVSAKMVDLENPPLPYSGEPMVIGSTWFDPAPFQLPNDWMLKALHQRLLYIGGKITMNLSRFSTKQQHQQKNIQCHPNKIQHQMVSGLGIKLVWNVQVMLGGCRCSTNFVSQRTSK